MPGSELIKLSDVDVSKVSFTKPMEKAHNIKRIYLNYGPENKKMLVQFPKKTLQFGVKYVDKDTGKASYSVAFSMGDAGLKAVIYDLEEKLIANANATFMKDNPITDANREFKFDSCLREPKKPEDIGKYDPILSAKLYEEQATGQFNVDLFTLKRDHSSYRAREDKYEKILVTTDNVETVFQKNNDLTAVLTVNAFVQKNKMKLQWVFQSGVVAQNASPTINFDNIPYNEDTIVGGETDPAPTEEMFSATPQSAPAPPPAAQTEVKERETKRVKLS